MFEKGKREGKECGESVPDLWMIKVPTNIENKNDQIQIEEGFICKSSEQATKWFWMPGSKCEDECECLTKCVEGCDFHHMLRDTGFLVFRGPNSQQNGVYELKTDSSRNPEFFRHLEKDFLVYRKDGGWALGSGSSPQNVSKVHFTTEASQSVPRTNWLEDGRPVDILRVDLVSKAFSKEQMQVGEEVKDEGFLCDGVDNHRLFITKQGDDPVFCDGRFDCKPSNLSASGTKNIPADERFCSIIVDVS